METGFGFCPSCGAARSAEEQKFCASCALACRLLPRPLLRPCRVLRWPPDGVTPPPPLRRGELRRPLRRGELRRPSDLGCSARGESSGASAYSAAGPVAATPVKTGISPAMVLIGVVLIAAICGGAYLVTNNGSKSSAPAAPAPRRPWSAPR